MTTRRSFAFVIIAFSAANICLADDDFSTPLTLHIPKSTPNYLADPAHEVGDSAVYQTHGKIYPEETNTIKLDEIAGTTEPMITFKKLINAYAAKDINTAKSIYDPEGAASITKIMADPQILTRWIAEAGRIGDGQLVAVIQTDPDNYFFFVKYPNTEGTSLPVPIIIRRENNVYYAASGHMSDKMTVNVLMFLCGNHSEKLVK